MKEIIIYCILFASGALLGSSMMYLNCSMRLVAHLDSVH